MTLTLRWVTEAIQGRIIQGGPETAYVGISTDSRSLKSGEVFWALKGERFDGHDFLGDAASKGARGLVIQRGRSVSGIKEGPVIIEVEDTFKALGECASSYRRLYDIPVVAVTGSNGKTTTKEMIASILALKKQVLRNKGNLNNLVGLPLSLLQLAPWHQVAVVELGMNRKGEIARLTEISDPTVGLITNIGPVHLEHLKSLEAVAGCKAELFQNMPSEATAIINKDDPRVDALSRGFLGKKVTFGIHHSAQVSARNIKLLGSDGIMFDLKTQEAILPIYLPMIGEHNVMNALAAATTVIALGESPEIIPDGLKNFTTLSLRQEIVKIGDDITLINDAYNANPVSMKAALSMFSELKGSSRGIVILGDMLELGGEASALHCQLGEQVARADAQFLLLMGEYASAVREGAIAGGLPPDAVVIGRSHKELRDYLDSFLMQGDWIFVKGSRKMRMEKVVETIGQKE